MFTPFGVWSAAMPEEEAEGDQDDKMNRLEIRAQFIKFGGLFFFAQDYRETIIIVVAMMLR